MSGMVEATIDELIECLYGFAVLASLIEDEDKSIRAWQAMRHLLA